jgi:hypothetical protein
VGIEALTSSGNNAGTLTITDAVSTQIKTVIVSGVSRRNIVHKLNGGLNTDSKVFTFSWTAPATGTGDITFYFAGNAANGNGSETNDYIYTGSQVFTELCPTPAQPGAIVGSTNLCAGSSQTYSITPVSGATSYTWTLPSGWTGTSTSESIYVTSDYSSGDILVSAVNACGTGSASSITITTNQLPVPVISILQGTINDTLFSDPASNYQWYLNGITITNENYQYIVPPSNGNYAVEVTDANGCTGTSAVYSYVTLGITNQTYAEKTLETIFQNDQLIVLANDNIVNSELDIINSAGVKVYHGILSEQNKSIDFSGQPEGVYIIVAFKNGKKIVNKILISR